MSAPSLLVVLPVLVAETADPCTRSILREDSAFGIGPEQVLIVDNSRDGFAAKYAAEGFRYWRHPDGHNCGTSRSWNVGAREVLAEGLDYLVILSASMLFGPVLNATWLWQMERAWGVDVIESEGHSWHLTCLHRRLFELVGLFDENYYPAYHEQVDWCTRLRILGREDAWTHAWVNALSTRVAGHLRYVCAPADPLLAYYRDKWGGDKGEERFVLPWGDKPMGWFPEVPIPDLAACYGLGERGEGWW